VIEYLDDAYEAKERDILVRRAISRLSHTYRVVVELCDLQDMSLREAAARLGLTLPAVKTRRVRARRQLKLLTANLPIS
jgi:RNA polymerase sigma factor (sigma-70 family)